MHNKIAAFTLIGILLLINYSIMKKEQHIADGNIIYLQLAPVDPRSLMQGDYMRLRFEISNQVSQLIKEQSADGYLVVSLDEQRVATFARLDKDSEQIQANELKLQYRIRGGRVKFATNAFFFEEGQAKAFNAARYGQFRVNDSGELLLVAMFDKELQKIN